MLTSFIKPLNAKIRFPPIIDKFSRTLATPIASLMSQLSVSARIASNYHPNAKFLYIDGKKKCIKYEKQKISKVNFIANAELLKQPATNKEELFFVKSREVNEEEIDD